MSKGQNRAVKEQKKQKSPEKKDKKADGPKYMRESDMVPSPKKPRSSSSS